MGALQSQERYKTRLAKPIKRVRLYIVYQSGPVHQSSPLIVYRLHSVFLPRMSRV